MKRSAELLEHLHRTLGGSGILQSTYISAAHQQLLANGCIEYHIYKIALPDLARGETRDLRNMRTCRQAMFLGLTLGSQPCKHLHSNNTSHVYLLDEMFGTISNILAVGADARL
jgi:hypothetical protein